MAFLFAMLVRKLRNCASDARTLWSIYTCDFLNYCVNFNYCLHNFLCSHLLCVVLQFSHYLNRNRIKICKRMVHNPFLNFKVHTIVEYIAGVNAPIHYNATHNNPNHALNSLRLINRSCEWILRLCILQLDMF